MLYIHRFGFFVISIENYELLIICSRTYDCLNFYRHFKTAGDAEKPIANLDSADTLNGKKIRGKKIVQTLHL